MEIKPDSSTPPTSRQFIDLLQQFICIRSKLMVPEPVVRFKKQVIDKIKNSRMDSVEDHHIIPQIFILLAQRETPPTMGELSADLNTPFSTTTRIVDLLVQSEIVERFSDPDDRRVVRVQMTESGRQIYQSLLEYNEERITCLLNNFSPEEKTEFLRLLNKLLDSIQADGEAK